MALWLCEGCGTLYAVGLYRCPRCHGEAGHEFGSHPEDEENPMAKITQHGGPTDATLTEPEPAEPVVVHAPASDELEIVDARPKAGALKGDWEVWAVEAGYDEDYVASCTKADLQELPDDPAAAEAYQAWLEAATDPGDDDGPDEDPADDAEDDETGD